MILRRFTNCKQFQILFVVLKIHNIFLPVVRVPLLAVQRNYGKECELCEENNTPFIK